MSGRRLPDDSWRLALGLARREFRAGLSRLSVFVACLVLGIAAIAGIGSVSATLLASLQENGRALLGGDVDLRLAHREIDEEQAAWLASQGSLSHIAEIRAMARNPAPGGARVLVELKAVDAAYPLYGDVVLAPQRSLEEALAPETAADGETLWGAAIESGLLQRLGLALGDVVDVGTARFRIAAQLQNEPDRVTRGLILGPPFMTSMAALEATALNQPGSLIRHHYRLRLPPGSDLAAFRARLEARYPDAAWRVTDARNASPRTERFVNRLTQFLTLVGLASLLIGGVGVGNAVRSYLDGKTETIASLKCLGASSRLIFRIYLLQILMIAAAATAIGLLLGALCPFFAAPLLAEALGWQIAAAFYPTVLGYAAAFGLLTAVTFSLWPLARARAVSAAQLFRDKLAPGAASSTLRALAAPLAAAVALALLVVATASDRAVAGWFVIGAAAAMLLFFLAGAAVRRLASVLSRRTGNLLRLALANLQRPGAATGSVILSLGLGLTLLVAIATIEGNLARQVERVMPEEAPSFYFIDIQPDQLAAFKGLVAERTGDGLMGSVPMLRGRITAIDDKPIADWEIPDEVAWVFRGDRGLTWSAAPPEGAELLAGDWWPAAYEGPLLVSLDAAVGTALGIGPGDRLTVNVLGRPLTAEIANLRKIDWSGLGINFVLVFSPGVLAQAPQSHIATVKVPADAETALEIAVTDSFPNISSVRVKEALQQVGALMGQIAVTVKAVAAFAILSGILVLAGALASGQRQRLYDAVVFKVLGATRRRIALAYLIEYGLLGVLSALLASLVGSLAAYVVLTEVMHADFVFEALPLITTLLAATLLTLLFGFAATYRALGQKPAPLLRNR